MPGSDDLLRSLTRISLQSEPLAILWHVLLAASLVLLGLGWRPSRRLAGVLLTLPLISVSAVALASGNEFIGVPCGLGAIALAALALGLPRGEAERSTTTLTVWGLLLIEFGWIYPHFLGDHFALAYLYAAPLGLVPGPTLAMVTGFAILGRGFEARAWPSILGALGLCYGLFGALRLGVAIDALLTVGALILLGVTWSRGHAPSPAARVAET